MAIMNGPTPIRPVTILQSLYPKVFESNRSVYGGIVHSGGKRYGPYGSMSFNLELQLHADTFKDVTLVSLIVSKAYMYDHIIVELTDWQIQRLYHDECMSVVLAQLYDLAQKWTWMLVYHEIYDHRPDRDGSRYMLWTKVLLQPIMNKIFEV